MTAPALCAILNAATETTRTTKPQLTKDNMKQFHIGDVLSISTGMLLSLRGMEGIYDICNYLTGDQLFTHQLPRAFKECQPWILRQHPELATPKFAEAIAALETTLKVSKVDYRAKVCRRFVENAAREFGEVLNVEPIPKDDHERIDPMTELVQMVGKDRIIAVKVDDDNA